MLFRARKSRIYFLRQFFNYPITLNADTVTKLGPVKIFKIGLSYMRAVMFPIKDEQTLEQFFINRFGRELYLTFFKSYTEKVWGVPCNEISAPSGAPSVSRGCPSPRRSCTSSRSRSRRRPTCRRRGPRRR